MAFEFVTAGRILFGPGALVELRGCTSGLLGWKNGKKVRRVLLVTGRSRERAGQLMRHLDSLAECVPYSVSGEPTIDVAEAGTRLAVEERCEVVIGCGGGSVLDAAKAIAALATNPGGALTYLEVIGGRRPLRRAPLPCIAIPTTAGTGSEVTRNAVLTSREHRVKVSLRDPRMLPRVAIVDPELTHELPPALTASTGMDALTQLIESLVSLRANPITDSLCQSGIVRASYSLLPAYRNGRDPAARAEMSMASLLGGLALANAGLGAVHGFAGPIGGMFEAPHGAVCAALLPHVMGMNIAALRDREEDPAALQRYEVVARIVTGDPAASPDSGVAWVEWLCDELEIPQLRTYGVTEEDIPALVEQAQMSSSMGNNPIELTDDELSEVLSRAI